MIWIQFDGCCDVTLSLCRLQVKVMTEQDLLAVACEQFLGKSVMEIKAVVLQTLEGHLRSILGTDIDFYLKCSTLMINTVWLLVSVVPLFVLRGRYVHVTYRYWLCLCAAGTLTVEQIYQDRDQFAKLVREVAAPDVGRMGIEILSFTIKVKHWQLLVHAVIIVSQSINQSFIVILLYQQSSTSKMRLGFSRINNRRPNK